MIVGDPSSFAIEWNVNHKTKGWIYGQLRFWADGTPVGNWDDSVDLKGVKNWLCAFSTRDDLRVDEHFFNLPSTEIFNTIYSNAFSNTLPIGYDTTLFKHYISHIGMSAFDAYDIIVVESESAQRFIWRSMPDLTIFSATLGKHEIQRISALGCSEMDFDAIEGDLG